MALSNTARFLIAAIFAAVIVVAGLFVMRGGPGGASDVETEVVLEDNGEGGCRIISKANSVTAHAGRKLTWNLNRDKCPNEEVVTVGNFRTNLASAEATCMAAVEGGAVWPFVEPVGDIKHRQNTTNPLKIELHIAPANALPGSGPTVEYHYDICTGTNAGVKADPLLVIEK
jgi:hypothetical protein